MQFGPVENERDGNCINVEGLEQGPLHAIRGWRITIMFELTSKVKKVLKWFRIDGLWMT
jgi:hypothetical protein